MRTSDSFLTHQIEKAKAREMRLVDGRLVELRAQRP
jgi:hypothetical protein